MLDSTTSTLASAFPTAAPPPGARARQPPRLRPAGRRPLSSLWCSARHRPSSCLPARLTDEGPICNSNRSDHPSGRARPPACGLAARSNVPAGRWTITLMITLGSRNSSVACSFCVHIYRRFSSDSTDIGATVLLVLQPYVY